MSFYSDHSWSSSDTPWNSNNLSDLPVVGPQDAPFSAVPLSRSSNPCPLWLDPKLFEGGGLHIPNNNVDINHFPYGENPNALKDESTHLGISGQAYTAPSATGFPATTTGLVNANSTVPHVPRYSTFSSSVPVNPSNSALDMHSSAVYEAYLEGFRNGAGLLPSTVSSPQCNTKPSSDGTNAPEVHNLIEQNTYSTGFPNTVPQPSIPLSAPYGPVVWQCNPSPSNAFSPLDQGSLTPPTLPPLTENVPLGQMQSQSVIYPDALGELHLPFTHTNSLVNNAVNWSVGSQHSTAQHKISPTERKHTVSSAGMLDTKMPSTSEEVSSVELISQNTGVRSTFGQNSRSSPVSPSSHFPSQSNTSIAYESYPNSLVPVPSINSLVDSLPETSKKGPKQKRRKQLLPSRHLWVKTKEGRYACQYNGPAISGQCSSVVSTPRNLGRHMREVHAHQEMKMGIPDDQRIALNSMPDGLKTVRITCPYSDKDLNKCRYYREEGRRWETIIMNRGARFLRQHILCYHREKS